MNNRTKGFIAILIAIALALSLTSMQAVAKNNKDKGKPDKAGNSQARDHDKDDDFDLDIDLSAMITAGISTGDARKIAQKHSLTGAQPLPPGIRKNLARGKPLPPGIAKKSMPGSFLNDLPRHNGYEWQQAGSDLVLVASATLVVSDILEGVFD